MSGNRIRVVKMLTNPSLCCLPQAKSINLETKYCGKEKQLYLENQQTEKVLDEWP